jgi:hydrogenase expression/formation protein HypE
MPPASPIPIGKLPVTLLRELLQRYGPTDPRVVLGPGVGEDATIIDMGDRYLVAKTDPITFATDEIGYYAVHVNANDLACCGATPRWFLATLLLPERETTPELVDTIFGQIAGACRGLGVSLCGGHTEITFGLDRPIVVGQMLGEVATDAYLTSRGARVGDSLVLTKGIAVEGTAIIAREKRDELRGVLSEADLRRCAGFLHEPGISVVCDARLAIEAGGVHALHDPTEGGAATGLWELAEAAQVGLVVDEARLPLVPECATLCRRFGLDPLGLIASGSLVIAAARDRATAMVDHLKAEGIAAAEIGEVVPAEQGCRLRSADGSLRPLPTFARDEITRLFE